MSMGNATELKEIRQKTREKILNNIDLVRLVLNDKSINDIDADIQQQLIDNNVFDFMYVPDIPDEEKQFITFDMNLISSKDRPANKGVSLYFFIFCHKGIIRDDTGYLRTDLIDELIQDIFNGKDFFGLGDIVCTSDNLLTVGTNYYGRQVRFETTVINKNYCSGQYG